MDSPFGGVKISFSHPSAKVKDGDWVNLEQIWTIHTGRVEYQRDGTVENMRETMRKYRMHNKDLYRAFNRGARRK
jgi:predicted double-glycine peptidase